MTSIRPGLPAPTPAPQPPAMSPARAELMRMMGITAPTTTAAPAATSESLPATRPVQVRLDPAAKPDPNQPVRPGSFLDIRV